MEPIKPVKEPSNPEPLPMLYTLATGLVPIAYDTGCRNLYGERILIKARDFPQLEDPSTWRWAIFREDSGVNLAVDEAGKLSWDWEPSPGNRTERFLSRTRFTLEQAQAHVKKLHELGKNAPR